MKKEKERKMETTDKRILDACCGSRMFWFDRHNPDAIYMDCRETSETLCDGRKLIISPDIIGDFRSMPFADETFHLVVFDPPHLHNVGERSWLGKKYGRLNPATWKDDLCQGFRECFRVLKPNGVLVFKWNETQIKLKNILPLIDRMPLFGNRTKTNGNTIWLIFIK